MGGEGRVGREGAPVEVVWEVEVRGWGGWEVGEGAWEAEEAGGVGDWAAVLAAALAAAVMISVSLLAAALAAVVMVSVSLP
jgi:hypothetical protein